MYGTHNSLRSGRSHTVFQTAVCSLCAAVLSACGTMNLSELDSGPKARSTLVSCTKNAPAGLAVSHEQSDIKALRPGSGVISSAATATIVPLLLQSFSQAPQTTDNDQIVEKISRSAMSEAAKAASAIGPTTAALLPRLNGEADKDYSVAQTIALVTAQAEAAHLAASMSVPAANQRLKDADGDIPENLRNDPVFLALKHAVTNAAQVAQTDAAAHAGLTGASFASPTPASPPPSLSESNFKSFALIVRTALSAEPLAFGGSPSKPANGAGQPTPQNMPFKNAFVEYYSRYYHGTYVDRFGNTLDKPAISRTINNTEIAGAVQVMFELLYDYGVRTPVWQDAAKNYYPGGKATKPTVVDVGLVTPSSMLDEKDALKCGITPLKAQAIEYLATKAGEKSSALGGLVGGSFGGLHFGFGVLGKVSIGDNQTLSAVVSTALSKTGERAAEELSWRSLYWIGYSPGSTLADLVQQYLTSNEAKK